MIFGPLMLVCLILMYIYAANYTGKRPHPRAIIRSYVRYNIQKNRHAGLLTYIMIISFIFFTLAMLGLFLGQPPNKP